MTSGAPRATAPQQRKRIIISFFWAAFLVSAYDLIITVLSPSVALEGSAQLIRYTVLMLVTLPCAAAMLAFAGSWFRDRLAMVPIPKIFSSILSDIVAGVPLLVMVPSLFGGPRIGANPLKIPLMVAAIVSVAAAVWFLRHVTGRISVAIAGRSKVQVVAASVAVMIVSTALLHMVTVEILPGLYPSFHRMAAFAAVVVIASTFYVMFYGLGVNVGKRRTMAVLPILLIVSLPTGTMVANRAVFARQALVENAPFFGQIVADIFVAEQRIHACLVGGGESRTSQGRPRAFANARFENDDARRSVLLVTVDALRGDVLDRAGRFGAVMPNLRRIAQGSLEFSRAYSPGNTTPISIPGMVLGSIPRGGDDEPSASDCISWPFNRYGYRTEFHFTAHEYASLERTRLWPLASRGFFFRSYMGDYLYAAAVMKKVEHSMRMRSEPFFIWAHLSDVHSPFLAAREIGNPGRDCEATYDGQLRCLDGVLGAFFDHMMSEYPDVVWALSSDHGEAFGEHGVMLHGSMLYEEQVRVPLLIGGPQVETGIVPDPVSNVDLGATLLSLAGATLEEGVPTLPVSPEPPGSLASVLVLGKESCAVVDGSRKLIAEVGKGTLGLFDLGQDPVEMKNLISSNTVEAARLLSVMGELGCPHDLTGLKASIE